MPRSAATVRLFSRDREAIATIWLNSEVFIAGSTLLTAMLAAPSTPHRTGSVMSGTSILLELTSDSTGHYLGLVAGVTHTPRPRRGGLWLLAGVGAGAL